MGEPDYQAALRVLMDEVGPPHFAQASDYVTPGSTGLERARELEALRLADEDARERNAAIVRKIVDAALRIPLPDKEPPHNPTPNPL